MLSILNFSIAGPSVWKDPSTFLFNGCQKKQKSSNSGRQADRQADRQAGRQANKHTHDDQRCGEPTAEG